jgi:hypothetical protein
MQILFAMAMLAGLVPICSPTRVCAAENDGMERLDRLERRVNELAQRQERLMRRLEAQMDQRGQILPPGNPDPRPQAGPMTLQCPGPDCSQAKKSRCCHSDLIGLIILVGMVVNILFAIWIYTDIRKRNEGSGIFVALALLVGIPTAAIYAITRIGDKKP